MKEKSSSIFLYMYHTYNFFITRPEKYLFLYGRIKYVRNKNSYLQIFCSIYKQKKQLYTLLYEPLHDSYSVQRFFVCLYIDKLKKYLRVIL